MQLHEWETVDSGSGVNVRRMRVHNGWLYQVQSHLEKKAFAGGEVSTRIMWHAPVFVPELLATLALTQRP